MTGHRIEGSLRTHALGLHTDLYELRMLESYLRAGMMAPATFSLYIRPTVNRPWFVTFGVNHVLDCLDRFRYGAEELEYLRRIGVSADALEWLEAFEPSGELWAVRDGTVILADEPILEWTAPLPVAQLLETAVINLVQFSTLIATKAARVGLAARGRAVADFGFRRAQGLETGIEAALAAYVGGGFTTSNVEAGRRHGLQVVGTMAHSFVQAFDTEIDAFRAFVQDHPEGAVLLVDTYDTVEGVRQAIVVAQEMRERGHSLRGVRLDSGDLLALSRATRDLLDEAGFGEVEVLASGGLDEERIHALVEAGAPIDAFGVGTDLVVSKDRPALDIAYKLVAYGGEARAKSSEAKANLPGAKQVFRTAGPDTDLLALRTETHPGRALLEPVWRDGVRLDEESPAQVRARVEAELDTLPQAWRRPPYPESPPRPRLSAQLEALTARVRTSHHIPEQDAGAGRRTQ